MSLGYDGKLFILAFDHRGSFKEKMFGIGGREATPAEQERLEASKSLIWEGLQAALAGRGAARPPPGCWSTRRWAPPSPGRQGGRACCSPCRSRSRSRTSSTSSTARTSRPTSRPSTPTSPRPWCAGTPPTTPRSSELQAERLRRLGDLAARAGPQVPLRVARPGHPPPAGPGRRERRRLRRPPAPLPDAGGHLRDPGSRHRARRVEDRRDRHRRGLRPRLGPGPPRRPRRRSRRSCWDAAPTTPGWSTGSAPAAGVPGYAGFAIGRTIWWDAVKAWKEGTLTRAEAAAAIGAAYRKFIDVYEGAGR